MDLLNILDLAFEKLPERHQNRIINSLHRLLSSLWPFKGPYPTVSDGTIDQILVIKDSLISNAGKGLFTTQPSKENEVLCEYLGTHLNYIQLLRTKDWEYVYGEDIFIDAGPHPNVLARHINHHFDRTKINCDFIERDGKVFIEALRDINADEEIYADYGELYWSDKDL